MKKVSVIIPTYKRPTYLPRAIDSVLNSSYENIEVIVVDDNNDGDDYRIETQAMMDNLYKNDERVIYIKHECNKNGSAARNTGIRAASGDYLMFLDDDDEFLPLKIEKQVAYMDRCDLEYAACYTKYLDVFENGKIRKGTESRTGNMLAEELSRNFFVHAGSNLMIRKSVVEEIGGFDESFIRNQDIEFLVKLLRNKKIGFVDYVGLKVYLHKRGEIDYDELTRKFIETFKGDIESLSDVEKRRVYKMLGLQLVRYHISNKRIKMANDVRKEYGVGCSLVIRYYMHLFKRALTNTAYGFRF